MDKQNASQELPPQAALLNMIVGFMGSQAIYVAARLGIADLLKDGARSVEDLAKETKTDARSLYRVLRALSSLGVFTEARPRHFALTPLAEPLLTDAPGSLRAFASFMSADWHLRPWGDILHSVKTGEVAFKHIYGQEYFPYIGQNPEAARVFDDAMTSLSATAAPAIASAYDFSAFQKIVDVAGGHGLLLSAVLKANPNLQGMLFDVPFVVEGARPLLEAEGVSERVELAAGDFFESVPMGGDAYMMKHIIHDWDDERALKILRNCQRAMKKDGRLLLVEVVIPEGDAPSFGKFIDLEMLLFTGGCERTAGQYRELLDDAGFELTRIVPTRSPYSIVEARRR
ncbi:MAG TPA: methyltransferase [Pyrinomonadaceae bacterium]|jgi:ubiquinone/menaquinone biosynthesis C-methylase UbiE